MARVSSDSTSARSVIVTGTVVLTWPQLAGILCSGPGSVLHSGLTEYQSSVLDEWPIRRYGRFDVNASRSSLDKIAGLLPQMIEIPAMAISPRWAGDLIAIVDKPSPAGRA